MANEMLVLKIGLLPPGLNSSGGGSKTKRRTKGLLSMHHTEYSDIKKQWASIIQNAVGIATPEGWKGFGAGPVWMTVVRFSTGIMDRDNLYSSMKVVMDGLVRAGVFADDNEVVLPWPRIIQVKVSRQDHCGLVIVMRRMTDQEYNETVALRSWARSIGHPTTGEVSGAVEKLVDRATVG